MSVRCFTNKNKMVVTASFNPAFNGVIYPVGFYRSEACRQPVEGGTFVTMDLPLNACGMRKSMQVSLHERKLGYSFNNLFSINKTFTFNLFSAIKSAPDSRNKQLSIVVNFHVLQPSLKLPLGFY